MPTIHLSRAWSRWAGALSEVVKATRTAAAGLQEWTEQASPIRIITTLPGRVVEAESWETFAGLVDNRDLQDLHGLKIDVGELLGPRASIHFEKKSPALSIEVVGDDRVRVEGIFTEAARALGRGRQPPEALVTFMGVASSLAVLLCALYVLGSLGILTVTVGNTPQTQNGSDLGQSLLFIALVFVAVVSTLFAMARLFPTLEVLPEGHAPALVRFRNWVFAALFAIVTSLVASYLYDAGKH